VASSGACRLRDQLRNFRGSRHGCLHRGGRAWL